MYVHSAHIAANGTIYLRCALHSRSAHIWGNDWFPEILHVQVASYDTAFNSPPPLMLLLRAKRLLAWSSTNRNTNSSVFISPQQPLTRTPTTEHVTKNCKSVFDIHPRSHAHDRPNLPRMRNRLAAICMFRHIHIHACLCVQLSSSFHY